MRLVTLRSLPMIGCHAARTRLSEMLEPIPDLDAAEQRFMHLHLARCKRCRRMLESLRILVEELGRLPLADTTPRPVGIADLISDQIRRNPDG